MAFYAFKNMSSLFAIEAFFDNSTAANMMNRDFLSKIIDASEDVTQRRWNLEVLNSAPNHQHSFQIRASLPGESRKPMTSLYCDRKP